MLVLAALTLAVCVLTAAAHWPVLSAQALSFDDQQYMTGNVLVRNPSWRSAQRFLTEVFTPSTIGGYYQPLNMISLMADCALGGSPEDLRAFHRTNLALHVLNTGLLVLLLQSLFRRPYIAALVGLLFGVHPLTVEPVAWVGERKTLLAALFTLGSLVTYVRHTQRGGWRWLVAALIMYLLAMLSKPTAAALPLLLLLLDYWPLRRLTRRAIVEKVPFFVVLGLCGTITMISQARTASVIAPGEAGSARSMAMLCYAVPFYLKKLVWPTNLTSVYPIPQPLSLANPVIAGSTLAILIVFAGALASARRTRAVLSAWLFFFVALFPTLGLVQYTWMIASDKYVYLPMVGLLMLLAWALIVLWDRSASRGTSRRAVLVVAALLVTAAEIGAVRRQLTYWRDSLALAKRLLDIAPNEPAAHTQMGNALGLVGQRDEAIEHFREVLRLQPGNPEAQYNLGMALRLQGHVAEAIPYLRQSIQVDRKNADAFYVLGRALQAQGGSAEAAECFRAALRINPHLVAAHYALGQMFREEGRLEAAIEQFRRCLEVAPRDANACALLGAALLATERPAEAAPYLRRAIEIDPDIVEAQAELGRLLAQQGELEEAIVHLRHAVSLDPERAEGHYNLGVALRLKGDVAEATACYQEVVRLKPDHAEARNALGNVLAAAGRSAEALAQFRAAIETKPGWVPPLNAAAWLLATCADDAVRKEREAVTLAERAAELTAHREAAILDTLAAAYASAGQFEQAVSTAEQALEVARTGQSAGLGREIGQRLALYRQRQPYREPAASTR